MVVVGTENGKVDYYYWTFGHNHGTSYTLGTQPIQTFRKLGRTIVSFNVAFPAIGRPLPRSLFLSARFPFEWSKNRMCSLELAPNHYFEWIVMRTSPSEDVLAAWNAPDTRVIPDLPMFAPPQFGWRMGAYKLMRKWLRKWKVPNIPEQSPNRFCVYSVSMIRAILFLGKQPKMRTPAERAFISRIGSCRERAFMFFSIRLCVCVLERMAFLSVVSSFKCRAYAYLAATRRKNINRQMNSMRLHTHSAESSRQHRECCACVKCKYLNSN